MSLTATVQANARAELSRKNLSVNEAAMRLGISRQTMSAKLNGHSAFSFDEIDTLAEWLEIKPERFFLKADSLAQAS